MAKLGPKKSKLPVSQNLLSDQFEYGEFDGDTDFFSFRPDIHFLGKVGPKIQNCLFKVNLEPRLIRMCRIL